MNCLKTDDFSYDQDIDPELLLLCTICDAVSLTGIKSGGVQSLHRSSTAHVDAKAMRSWLPVPHSQQPANAFTICH